MYISTVLGKQACPVLLRLRLAFTSELLLDVFFRQPPGLRAQHGGQISLAHADLVSDRDEVLGKVLIVLGQQLDRHHKEVDVPEDKGLSSRVRLLLPYEVQRLIAPMAKWV